MDHKVTTPIDPREGWRQALALGPPTTGWRDRQFWIAWLAGVPVAIAVAIGLEPQSTAMSPAMGFSFVVWQPFWEELVFRGIVQTWLLRQPWARSTSAGFSRANLLTSALFSIAHLWHQPLAWAVAVTLPSLIFGHLRERSHSVWPAVVIHASYNAMFLLAVYGASRLA
ncbi:MAG: JDVT-CTERM system glutamic-type intramembrane protease [Thiotrichales bacterium]